MAELGIYYGESKTIAVNITGIDDITSVIAFIDSTSRELEKSGDNWLLKLSNLDTKSKMTDGTSTSTSDDKVDNCENISIVIHSTSLGQRIKNNILTLIYKSTNAIATDIETFSSVIDSTISISYENVIEGSSNQEIIESIYVIEGTGGGNQLEENLEVSKLSEDSFTTAFTSINSSGNAQGYETILTLTDDNHDIGDSIGRIGGIYNGLVRFQATTTLNELGTNQNTSITLGGLGYIDLLGACFYEFESIRFIINSETQQIPIKSSKNATILFNYCFLDASSALTECSIVDGANNALFRLQASYTEVYDME